MVHGNGVGCQVISGQSSCSPNTFGDSGSSWWCTCDSANVDSSVRAFGRLAGHIVSSLLLLALSEFFWVCSLASPPSYYPLLSRILSISFQGKLCFPYWTFCCETVQASGYHHARPRQVVSVLGALTVGRGHLSSLRGSGKISWRKWDLGCIFKE